MIKLNQLYYNKNRLIDIVNVNSIEYDDGLKVVKFTRIAKKSIHQLPIEMFEKNFIEVPFDGN